MVKFQFTHPGKGATPNHGACLVTMWCFNSRTLGRVRRETFFLLRLCWKFQFTHPGKGATINLLLVVCHTIVSIHAPWEGCD